MKLETAGDRGEMSPPAVLLVLDTARRVCDMQERVVGRFEMDRANKVLKSNIICPQFFQNYSYVI